MKKGIIVALFALFGINQNQAQVTFRPGVRAGLNFAHFTKGDYVNGGYTNLYYDPNTMQYIGTTTTSDYKSKTDFNVGFYGALHLTKYYTLQPEINYSKQGSTIETTTVNNNIPTKTAYKYDVSYLSIGIINKFTFNDKFNFHVGPTVDFIVDKTRFLSTYGYNNLSAESDFDLAFTAGFGYNFTKNIGLEARVKKGIVPVIDHGGSTHTNVVFQLGATYTFDLK